MRASVSKWAVGVVCFLAGCARAEAQTAAVSYGGIGDPASAPGDPAQSYALSGLDHVNYYNGQLNLTIPAYSIGGRGSVSRNIVVQVERQWAALDLSGSWTPFSGQEDLQGAEVYTGGYVTLYNVSGNASECAHTVNGITTYTPLGPILSYMVYTAADGTETVMRDLVSNGQPQDATLLTCSQTYTPFDRGRVFQSSDGSDLTFVANSDVYDWGPTPAGTLITRDGTKYSFGGNYISQIEDRNGNQINFAFSSTSSGGIYTVTDPLGRTPTINFTEDPATDLQDVITYEGVGGSYPVVASAASTRTVTVNYALLGAVLDTKDGTTQKLQTYSCLFPELSGSSTTQFNPYVVSSVVLADGTSYSILYNSYGEPARLTLPTGAYYVYKYPEASNCAANTGSGVVNLGNGSYAIYRRVQERDEYANGTNLTAKILFSAASGPTDPNFGSRATTKATVVFEDQNSAVLKTENHYFYGNPAPTAAPTANATQFADWWLGREYRTEIVDPTQGTQQTTQMAYGQRSCPGAGESNCWYTVSADTSPAHDTQLCQVNTTLNSTTSGVTYLYDQYNNPTDQYQFDFGSAPALNGSCPGAFSGGFLQHTNTAYLTSASYVAASTNLVGLPTETKVYDSGGNLNSDVKYGYDTFSVSGYSSLTGYASMTGHDSGYSASGVATRGNLTSVVQGLNTGGGGWLGSYLAYDIAGNVVATEDANSNVTKYSYTDNYSSYSGTPTYGHATGATNALSQTSFSAQYDYASVQTVLSKDINKTATSYSYDTVGPAPGKVRYSTDRLIQVKQAVGTGAEAWTGYTYNSPIDIVTKRDQVTKGDGVIVSEQFWDGLGRATTALADGGLIETDTTYDALGRVATVTNPYQPAAGFTPLVTIYGYDALGRQTSATTPDSQTAKTSYSGNTATFTDQAGNGRELVSDALGRLTDVYEDPLGSKFHTSYGRLNNTLTVSQSGQTRTFVYDTAGRLTSAANPESGLVSYTYDNAGNMLSRTDARGTVTCYGTLSGAACSGSSYDALNRPGSVSYSDGLTPKASFTYDAVTNGLGQLTAVSNGNSTTQFTAFDALGRVTGSQQQTQGQIYTFSYTYNLAGSLATETYPSARVVTTTYDAANRPYTLAGNLSGLGTSYVTQTTYWPNGGVNALMRGNALVHSETYNSRLQLAAATEQVSGGAQLLGLGLSWVNPATNNNNGTLQSVTATTPGLGFTQAYAYDALNRVIAAAETSGTTGTGAQNWAQSYKYDAYGNMWMPSTSLGAPAVGPGAPTTNVYSAAGAGNNRNATLDAASGYDKAGNLLNFGSVSVTYDGENRQVTAGSNGYYYDGLGQRIGRMAAGVPTVYVYDAFGLLASEYSTGTVTYACATCYLAGDHLGSTRLVTDGSANVVGRHDYAPFGQEILAGVGGRVSPWGASDFVNQKFTGQERDVETNLDFFQARYLASGLGRFMSPDPGNAGADFTNPQSWNGYGYVLGNPLALVDPSGLDAGGGGGDDPDPCFDDPTLCDAGPLYWPPVNPPPAPPTTVEEPLPPGSFPGGETLGVPAGLKIPGPLSWQSILGLWDWDCSGSFCVPGVASDSYDSAVAGRVGSGGYWSYAGCFVLGALPKALGAAAFGIGGTAVLGKSFPEQFMPPPGIINKLPVRAASTGLKWGTKGSYVGAALFLATFEVEINQGARSCSQSTGYVPWIFQ